MKNIITFTLTLILIIIQFGCEQPAPTELINDSDEGELLEFEVLTNDLNQQYVTSGTDTTGVIQDFRGLRNLISVSSIKITNENHTAEFCLAQGFFFDWSQPVYYSNARLLGFRTVIPGLMKFNEENARIVEYRVRYRDRGETQDTVLGNKFLLYRSKSGWGDPFWFESGTPVNFNFEPFGGDPVNFEIQTPKNITGTVSLQGSHLNRDLAAKLEWNKVLGGKVSIVVSLIKHGQINAAIPLYRFGVTDKSTLIIPERFFSGIQFQDYRKLVFTFIRSYGKLERQNEINLFVSSQSIHSILVDIP